MLQELIVSSNNFEFKVNRSVSRSKLLPLLLSLPNIFDLYSSISLFLLTSPCFRNWSSSSKDFLIPVLLLTKSFSSLLNFSSYSMKTLICGINSSNNLHFRASMRSSFVCVPMRSFPIFSFDLLEESESFSSRKMISVFTFKLLEMENSFRILCFLPLILSITFYINSSIFPFINPSSDTSK